MSLRNMGSTLEEFSKESESFMDYIVISDKTWAYYFYPETKISLLNSKTQTTRPLKSSRSFDRSKRLWAQLFVAGKLSL